MEAAEVARLEFALLAGIHFLFVLVTLGLGPVVAIFGTRWARAERRGAWQAPVLERATRFWGQLYLVNYALGIAAGIVLELQFGLHFPGLLDVAGEVFGAPLAIETLGAFFLESTLLGLWVFGWHMIPRTAHHLIFWGVVATGYASAFTVMVANGFLRNPVGYELTAAPADGGTAVITDPVALILNPAAILSAFHVLGACLGAGGALMVGVAGWHLLRGSGVGSRWGGSEPADLDEDMWRRSMRAGIVTAAVGQVVAHGFGYTQFGYIGRLAESVPGGGSGGGVVATLAAVSLGVMTLGGQVAQFGALFLLLGLVKDAVFRMPRGPRVALYRLLIISIPVPFVLAIFGWLARELGRQPWVVAGVLRTQDAVSDQPVGFVVTSLLVLVLLMGALAVVDGVVLGHLAARGADRLMLGAHGADVLGAEADDEADGDALLRFTTPTPSPSASSASVPPVSAATTASDEGVR